MTFREARKSDIPQMQIVRNAVKENRLSDPRLVPDSDYEDYIHHRGKGWVCEVDNRIAGFAIISLVDNNVWALFVHPGFDRRGIGRRLHVDMLDWYFRQTSATVWLSTAPGTRAVSFYHKSGWTATGITKNGEVKFEMQEAVWKSLSKERG